MTKELVKRYKLLKEAVKKHNTQYRLGQPLLEDESYDQLLLELKNLEAELQLQTSSGITDPLYGTKINHVKPVLSLDHGFEEAAIRDFIKRMKTHAFPLILEHKIDGVSLSARYLDGTLNQLLTRGNGIQGIDVTNKVSHMMIPNRIEYLGNLEVRGELYTTFEEFERIKHDFTSPRNYCAAFLHGKHVSSRIKLFFAIHECFNLEKSTYLETLDALEKLGLPVVWRTLAHTEQEAIDIFWQQIQNKYTLEYPIDGIVLKINDNHAREEMGSHLTAPRYAFAVKMHPKPTQTKILNIELSIGKFGNITPIAIIEPVKINGYEINRVSLHNIEEIERNQYGIGDLVSIEHTGDAVPQISNKIFDAQNKFIISKCPSCDQKFNIENDKLKCTSGWTCLDQQVARITHFCSRNAMNIDSLANKKIKELVVAGLIKLPIDLFKLTRADLGNIYGWNKKSMNKFFHNLEKSKANALDKFLFALCIPNVGYGVAKKIAANFNTFDTFTDAFKNGIPVIPGIGKVIIESIKNFLQMETWIYELRRYLK